jgi:hypothetical protein
MAVEATAGDMVEVGRRNDGEPATVDLQTYDARAYLICLPLV